MKLVTVFSAVNPAEAEVARSRLDAAHFHPVVVNELSAFVMGFYSTALPVRVQVPEDEAEDAKQLLAAGNELPE